MQYDYKHCKNVYLTFFPLVVTPICLLPWCWW